MAAQPTVQPATPLPNGFLVVHKPANWTSSDVVGKVRNTLERHFKRPQQGAYVFRKKSRLKVGHGGTLDPLATGLLVLGVGSGTKLMGDLLSGPKSYVARAKLGEETDTLDSEGKVLRTATFDHVTREDLEYAAVALTGDIMQRPPIFSALHKNGERMYTLAREGRIKEEDVEPRPVTVHRLEVCKYDSEHGLFELDVSCSGGTYVRSLITDMARDVGSAAHMTALERTKHGPFAAEAEAVRATAAGLTACDVQPVYEKDLGNAERVLAGLTASSEALQRLRGGNSLAGVKALSLAPRVTQMPRD